MMSSSDVSSDTSAATTPAPTNNADATATPSTFKTAAQAGTKVTLVPWDPESSEHVKRLYDQRVAAGFKWDMVEKKWIGMQREGKMTIRWVVISESDPNRESKLAQHITRYPNQKTPLTDSALSFGGQPRQPPHHESSSFVPVGHISIDTENSIDPDLADASRGIYCVTTFYISSALQFGGLGRAAMDAIESDAAGAPCYAKVLTVDALNKAHYLDLALWKAFQLPIPTLSNQDWYERRGYEIFKSVEKASLFTDKTGKVWPLNEVLMRKTI